MVSQMDLANAINSLRSEMRQLETNRRQDVGDVVAAIEAVIDPMAGIDSGDTAWILTCTCLVLMMTLPGLALFYGGLSQAPNVLGTIMHSFAITCLVTVLWLIVGYTIAFGACESAEGCPIVGGAGSVWLTGAHKNASGTLPESLFIVFQCTFAVITAAIITGSFAERMRFGPMLIFIAIWHLIVYCPLAHFEWGGGFMSAWGVLDFAGGDVVHISSGVSGLAASLVVGKRKAFAMGSALPPHNILLVFMGGSLLWVGWFGFNAGSAVAANGSAGMAMLVTHISASTAGLTWIIIEWLHTGKPTVLGAVSGAVAGLVTITPGSGYLDQTGAFVCGITGAPVCYFGIKLKHLCGFDDALDAFGVHGVGGMWGGLLTGLFANPEVGGATSAFYGGNGAQVGIQIAGIVFTSVFSFIMTLIIIVPLHFGLKAATGLGCRVSEEAEDTGIDISEHGESMVAHPPPSQFDAKAGSALTPVVAIGNDAPP